MEGKLLVIEALDAVDRLMSGGCAGEVRSIGKRDALGAERPSFDTIVAHAEHGALPHAVPRETEIVPGSLVTIDWGAQLDGYASDCTRT